MKKSPRQFLALLAVLLFLTAFERAGAQVYISEFLADNQTNAKVDEDGDHADWIEIWNSGVSAVSLNGWYLTDDSGDLRKWQFPVTTPVVSLASGARIVVFASNKNRKLDITKLHTSFKLAKNAGSYLALVRADGLTVEHAYASYPQQVQDIAYGITVLTSTQTLVAAGAAGKARVPTSAADFTSLAGWNTNPAFDDSAWQAGVSGFGYDTLGAGAGSINSLIGAGGNLQASMYLVNSTALVRFVFNIVDPTAISSLKLSLKYDDGFNCYVNGHLIQQSFSGGTAWNSTAVSDRLGSLTGTYAVFTPSGAQQWLVAGQNVVAFQMLNSSNGSVIEYDTTNALNGSRALCLPFLEGTVVTGIGAPSYLATATPGTVNSAALTALGPSVTQTTENPARPIGGAGSAPIVITAKVVPSLKPLNTTNPVQLKYLVMFAAETSVTMKDDGIAPDAIAGDTIFTAQIPTTAMTAGQMLRWRVEAKDNASTAATDPPYRDTADNDRYFGTVALDNITTSSLPILHWFITDADLTTVEAADNNFVRTSFFYLGKFYDNVRADRHGQSTAGFPKKSYNFNFNQDNQFKWKLGENNIGAINMLTSWADKSKVRNQVAWEAWDDNGHIASHWSQIVRLQKNAVFHAIYDMGENGDEGFLQREKLDPYGAFYKVYNSLENASGVEKKTGFPLTDVADLTAFETALDPATKTVAQRRQYAYDNVDMAAFVNYMAVNVIVLNNDFGHKNYYIYRDTFGTREWSLIPWDQDLSFGHTWTASQGYFNDDIDSQRGLVQGAAPGNRLMNLIMNTTGATTFAPEMVNMFLRRLRTLQDKYYISAAATDGPFEQRMNALIDQIDPPAVVGLTDADLDLQKWGYWTDGGGGQISPGNAFDAATYDHGPRKTLLRVIDNLAHTGNPTPSPYPGAVNNAEGLGDTTKAFLYGRRTLFYTGNPTLNNVPIPAAQVAAPAGLTIEYVEANPASGNQAQEFFIIRNNSADYLDISGWKITGAVDFTFYGGTVIPPFTAGSAVNATTDVHAGRLHVTRDNYQFRQRTVSPKGNEYRQVTGPYSGQLSARGETINLVKPGATLAEDVIIATTTYAGTPTASQSFLRITEINYNPAPPTAAETLALPGVSPSDFEFIEFINSGASPLNIGGAVIDKGVTFTFPVNFTLQPGQRCVVVSLLAAYNLRYGGAGALVAGQCEGNLANDGETIQVIDSVGESILQFKYEPLWFGVPKPSDASMLTAADGYSFVTRSTSPAWDGYEQPTVWALADPAGGTPGAGDTNYANVFVGWTKSYFTPAGEANPAYGGPGADPDNDGRSNFEEFIFGGNPLAFETRPLPVSSVVSDGGVDYLAITFDRRHHAIDTTLLVQASGDLTTWSGVNVQVGTATDLGNGMERVTYRDSAPLASGQRFLRVRATR